MFFAKLAAATAAISLTLGGSLAAAPPPEAKKSNSSKMTQAASETPPGQIKRPNDPDMGDEMAAITAIVTVCFMDTPAAERSAICDRTDDPVSP